MTAGAGTPARVFPFLPLLSLILAAAKVFGTYSISWLWVLSPIWLPLAVVFGIWLVVMVVIGLVTVVAGLVRNNS